MDLFNDTLDDFQFNAEELDLILNDFEIDWNDEIETLSLPSDLDPIYEPMPLIRYGGMGDLSHIPDEFDSISPLWMSSPIQNEDDDNPTVPSDSVEELPRVEEHDEHNANFSTFSNTTEEFDQNEYLLVLGEIRSVEEEIRHLEAMAEFFRVAQIYEPTRFQNETSQGGSSDGN